VPCASALPLSQRATGVQAGGEKPWICKRFQRDSQQLLPASWTGRSAIVFVPVVFNASITPTARTSSGSRRCAAADFRLDVEAPCRRIADRAHYVWFVASPNNPSLQSVRCPTARLGCYARILIVDEALWRSFLAAQRGRVGRGVSDKLVVTRTMSKAFSFAVVSLALMPPRHERGRCLFAAGRITFPRSHRAAAGAALRHAEIRCGSVFANADRRTRTGDTALSGMGFQVRSDDANFVFVWSIRRRAGAPWAALPGARILIPDVASQ